MALEEFRLRAAIDRVRLVLELETPTQFRHLRDRLPAGWVTARIDPCEGQDPNTCHSFTFWLQDPPGPALLAQQLADALNLTSVEITGVEIAIDAYPRSPAPAHSDRLADAAMHLVHHHAQPPGVLARIAMPGRMEWVQNTLHAHQALCSGFTIRSHAENYSSGAYVKASDSKPGSPHAPLPASEHRARFEVTLFNELCPFRSLTEWAAFDFGVLTSKYFSMLAPAGSAPALPPLAEWLHSRFWLAQGLPQSKGPRATRRRSRAGTRRDRALNDRIRKALARLNSRCG